MRPEIHEDGTVTCWRVETREYARTHPSDISADSFARIGQADRERLAARFEILRALTEDRTMVRVKIEFVVALPLGSEIPDPQVEAVSSAALAIFGPCEFLGSSKVSVRRTRRRSSNVKARE